MKRPREQPEKRVTRDETKTPQVTQDSTSQVAEALEGCLAHAPGIVDSARSMAWDATKALSSWAEEQVSGGIALLTRAIRSSNAIGPSTRQAILAYVSSAYRSTASRGREVVNHAAIFANAILASDFSHNMESWLGAQFNEGLPSIYDAAVDAVYNATHIGGGHLHRLFDGSHTLWGMWDKVGEASPDDSFLQEITGYATALGKDLSSSVGIPLFDLSKSSYDQVADALNGTFGIPKLWFADLLHVNTGELVGTTIATIAVSLNWNKKQVKEFSGLAGSLGISSIASANPALAAVALATLAKSYVDAKRRGTYSDFVHGLAKGGVGTGAFLATASAVGGPVWVGILAGMCVGAVVHRAADSVEVSQIAAFVDISLRRAVEQLRDSRQMLPGTLGHV